LTFNHPIDTGNCGMLIAAMIALMASTTSVGLKNIYVQLGIIASLAISATSMSWSSYAGTAAAVGLFAAIWCIPLLGRVLPLIVIAMICGGFIVANRLEHMDLGPRENVGQTFSDSLWIRASIMQNSWPFASTAGAFGYGKTIKHSELNLDSVDNGYLLFTMTRGWVFLTLFLSLPLMLALRASWLYGRTQLPQHRLPVIISIAAVLGAMVAMFTVWFGFVYSFLWILMLAMGHSILDVLRYGPPQTATPPQILIERPRRSVMIRRPVPAAMYATQN
jgi:hypothetical protein